MKLEKWIILLLAILFISFFFIPTSVKVKVTHQVTHSETNDFREGNFTNLNIANGTVYLRKNRHRVWEDNFDSGDNDIATSIAIAPSGDVYVAGYSSVGYLAGSHPKNVGRIIKYNSDGDILWNKTYSSKSNECELRDIAVEPYTSEVIATGFGDAVSPNFDFYTVKIDPDGDVRWEEYEDRENNDMAYALDIHDRIYVAGFSNAPPPDMVGYVIQYDFNGAFLSGNTYEDIDLLNSIGVHSTGSPIIAGTTIEDTWNYFTAMYDSKGNLIWDNTYDSGDRDQIEAMATDLPQAIYVTGFTDSGNLDFCTIKYDNKGKIVWKKSFNSINNDEAKDIAIGPSGSVYVVGYSHNGTNQDYSLLEYSQNGVLAWRDTTLYDSGDDDVAQGIAIDSSSIYITGKSNNGSDDDFYTIKYSSEYSSSGELTSNELDSTSKEIHSATATWNSTVPKTSSLKVEISNDNGNTWKTIENGTEHEFTSKGSQLKYRTTLSTSEETSTPELSKLKINYKTKTGEASTPLIPLPSHWPPLLIVGIGLSLSIGLIAALKFTGKLKLPWEKPPELEVKYPTETAESPYKSTIADTYYGMLKSAAKEKSGKSAEVKRREAPTKPFEKEKNED